MTKATGTRRKAREAALQFLFQEDFKPGEGHSVDNIEERFASFCTLYQINRQARPYALAVVTGIAGARQDIDEVVSRAASNWRLSRLAATDRNILRFAAWEMMQDNDVPDQVAINEAVEIAKRFGSQDSPSFINGVLDAVRKVLRS